MHETANEQPKRELMSEIAELEEPIKRIIEQIRPHIEAGEYSLIIGDDASGRIPTRIMEWFLEEAYQERGYPKAQTVFIVGGLDKQACKERLSSYFENKPKRILIVTDIVKKGKALSGLISALRENNFDFDLVTMRKEPYKEDPEEILGPVIEGGLDTTPYIYRRFDISGVLKEKGDKLPESWGKHQRIVKEILGHKGPEDDQVFLNTARKNAKMLSQHLIEWYKQKYGQK